MGKVSRRLTIVALPPVSEWPEIAKLREQGHTIIDCFEQPEVLTLASVREADLIIGPQCWYFDIKHRKYLTSAIKQARLKRYGVPAKKAGKKNEESIDEPSAASDVSLSSEGD